MVGRPSSRKPSEFGKRLVSLREEAGLTQSTFAERIGVSQQLVTYYERRGGNPTLEFINKAAAALGTSPDALLPSVKPTSAKQTQPRRRGRPSDFERNMAERLEKLRKLPKDKQRFVLGMIDAALQNAGAE